MNFNIHLYVFMSLPLLIGIPTADASPVQGQIVVDPNHPSRMVYHDTWIGEGQMKYLKPCVFAGPGDPEDFFYNDTQDNLSLLINRKAKCTYITAYLKDFGGGHPGSGERLKRTLDRWDQFISALEQAGVITVFFLFDDDYALPPQWESAVDQIVNRLKHHKLLIWSVAEEYAEKISKQDAIHVAERIRSADDRNHVVGIHQNTGTHFDFKGEPSMDMFLMQFDNVKPQEVHKAVLASIRDTQGKKIINMSEITEHGNQDRQTVRRINWAAAMAGASAVQVIMMGRASEPAAVNDPGKYSDCAILTDFLSSLRYNDLVSHDELALAEAEYVMAKPGECYLVYSSRTPVSTIGVKEVGKGRYRLRWLDCVSGQTKTQADVSIQAGDVTWKVPKEWTGEIVLYLERISDSGITGEGMQ